MTVSSIIEKVKSNLNEVGLNYYTEADILEIIQEGYNEIVTLTGCIEKYLTYPQINDLIYYDFNTTINDFYALVGMWNTNTKRWLNPRTLKEARLLRYDWELWEGEPDNYLITSFKLVGVFPTKQTATGSFIIFYNSIADTLSTTSVPKLPSKHYSALENYATGVLLEQSQEFSKAQEYLEEYLNSIPRIKSAAKLLAATDRYMIMGDSMPRFAEALLGDEMWVDLETPTVVNPSTLTIAGTPSPPAAFYLFRDGILMYDGIGYTRSGSTITLNSGYEDVSGTLWRASYRTI